MVGTPQARLVGGATRGSRRRLGVVGPLADELEDRFSADWLSRNRDPWRTRHNELAEVREAVEELESREASEPLPAEDGWRLVALTSRLDSERAFELARTFVERHPDHAPARFVVGRGLLARGDGRGVEHLERAATLDGDFIVPAAEIAAGYFVGQGQTAEAEVWQQLAAARQNLLEAADAERRALPKDMELGPAELPELVLSELRTRLARFPDAVEVYLVRRTVRHLAGVPCFLAGIRPRRNWRGAAVINEPKLMESLRTEIDWPHQTFTVALVGKNRWLRDRLQALGSSLTA